MTLQTPRFILSALKNIRHNRILHNRLNLRISHGAGVGFFFGFTGAGFGFGEVYFADLGADF